MRETRGDLHGRVVVITGASSGIGAATACAVARAGARPILVARRAAALQDVASRCGVAALCLPGDMTVPDDVQRVALAAVEQAGHVDIWISNVGRGITRRPSELTDADIDSMMLVNVKPALYGVQAMLPHFRSRGEGHFLHVSSVLGRMPSRAGRSAYSAAKHFLNSFTADLRDELRDSDPGIAVSLVSPGIVYTDFGDNALHGGPDSRSLPNGQSAEEVAEVIVDVMRARRADVYTRHGLRDRVLDYFSELTSDP